MELSLLFCLSINGSADFLEDKNGFKTRGYYKKRRNIKPEKDNGAG